MKKKKLNKSQTDVLPEMWEETESGKGAAEAADELAEEFIGTEDKDDTEPETADDGVEQTEDQPAPETKQENEWKERYTRQLAEFDNFRKRTEKEKSQMYDFGARAIAEKILPTIDNFERGLKGAPEGAFAEGMEMVYKELLSNLENAGVSAIECVGKEFDPNIHNAVMHEEDDSGEENIVTEELQKGYMYKDTLLRPSMVKVKN